MFNNLPPLSGPVDASGEPELPSPMPSFDAQVWAESFVAHVRRHPGIPTDEATMLGWFASALMRGFDEGRRRLTAAAAVPSSPAQDWIEQRLRQEWWAGHGCPLAALYGDDGEMQCNASTCMRDFKREPMERLREHVEGRRIALAVAALEALPPSSPVADSPTWQPIESALNDDGQDMVIADGDGLVGHGFFDRANSIWRWLDDDPIRNPTHWMPMPKPPSAPSPSAGAAKEHEIKKI